MVGKAQSTGTIGHATRIEYEAAKAVGSGADTVYLNRAWGTAAGVKATPKTGLAKRPDLIVQEGTSLRGIEVASKTDTVSALSTRLDVGASAVNSLGRGAAENGGVIAARSIGIGTQRFGYVPLPLTYGLGSALAFDAGYHGLTSTPLQ